MAANAAFVPLFVAPQAEKGSRLRVAIAVSATAARSCRTADENHPIQGRGRRCVALQGQGRGPGIEIGGNNVLEAMEQAAMHIPAGGPLSSERASGDRGLGRLVGRHGAVACSRAMARGAERGAGGREEAEAPKTRSRTEVKNRIRASQQDSDHQDARPPRLSSEGDLPSLQALLQPQPRPPTHYEPSRFVPGSTLLIENVIKPHDSPERHDEGEVGLADEKPGASGKFF